MAEQGDMILHNNVQKNDENQTNSKLMGNDFDYFIQKIESLNQKIGALEKENSMLQEEYDRLKKETRNTVTRCEDHEDVIHANAG